MRYDEFKQIADNKIKDEVILKDREIELAKLYLAAKKDEVAKKKAVLDAEVTAVQKNLHQIQYNRKVLTNQSNYQAMEMFKAALKEDYMPNETEEVFDKFFEVAREKADSYADIDSELEELLEFYQSVEKAKKG